MHELLAEVLWIVCCESPLRQMVLACMRQRKNILFLINPVCVLKLTEDIE